MTDDVQAIDRQRGYGHDAGVLVIRASEGPDPKIVGTQWQCRGFGAQTGKCRNPIMHGARHWLCVECAADRIIATPVPRTPTHEEHDYDAG